MSHIWLERYGSLFSEEINFALIRHSWKKWGLKHRRVFGSEAADNLYPFRPNPLPSTPTQSQPNSIPFLSPIQVWIEAQVRPTWPKEHQTLSFFFLFTFFPPTCCVQLLFLCHPTSSPTSVQSYTLSPCKRDSSSSLLPSPRKLPPAVLLHVRSPRSPCCQLENFFSHARADTSSRPWCPCLSPATTSHVKAPWLGFKSQWKRRVKGLAILVDRKRGLLVFLKGRKSKIRVGQ